MGPTSPTWKKVSRKMFPTSDRYHIHIVEFYSSKMYKQSSIVTIHNTSLMSKRNHAPDAQNIASTVHPYLLYQLTQKLAQGWALVCFVFTEHFVGPFFTDLAVSQKL